MKYLKIGHLFIGDKKTNHSLILCYRDMSEVLKFQQFIEYNLGICSYIEYMRWEADIWKEIEYDKYNYDIDFLRKYSCLIKKRDSAKDYKIYAYFDKMVFDLYEERKMK
jgi:hypothetical protein